MSQIIGWDIGGAHIKAVQINEKGQAVRIWYRVAPLWRGMHRLTDSITAIRASVQEQEIAHAVTMSGELADIFPTRSEGVRQISRALQGTLGKEQVLFFSSDLEFVDYPERQAETVGSMNWYASAHLAARLVKHGIFIDVGSTTTDLIQIRDHQVHISSYTDAERLKSGELLYTGVVRTPLMSLAPQVEIDGQPCNLMAEHFAIMADAYNLLGMLPEALIPYDTPDGDGCSRFESARRMARMIGRDCEEDDALDEWVALARTFADMQCARIVETLSHVNTAESPVLVGTGTGRFVLERVARESQMTYYDINTLLDTRGMVSGSFTLADCLPAYAVAELFRRGHADH